MTAVDALLTELRGLLEVPSALVDNCVAAARNLYLEGDNNPDAAELFDGLCWIARHTDKPALERLEAIERLLRLEGSPVIVDLRELTGWRS